MGAIIMLSLLLAITIGSVVYLKLTEFNKDKQLS